MIEENLSDDITHLQAAIPKQWAETINPSFREQRLAPYGPFKQHICLVSGVDSGRMWKRRGGKSTVKAKWGLWGVAQTAVLLQLTGAHHSLSGQ